ncbi:MarR family winged helix-turn-helix transcriptional regulator [Nocardia sp. NPDC004722]
MPQLEGPYREYVTAQAVIAQAAASALGLGATDFFALNLIALAGSLTAGELASRTGLSTGAVTRLIDRLERGGFVRRVPDATDRRKVLVVSIPDSDGRIEAVVGPPRDRLAEMFADYGPEQLEVLFDYFTRATVALREAAHDMLDRPRRV